tara:strand:+ start:82 stop:3099 length:3018 start_codon:yes stop_codon:yes gene_type:complete
MAVLRNVPKTFSFEEQRIEINEIAQDLYALSSGNLTQFSVTVSAASGSGNLSYDNTTGVFDYTPPDLSGYSTFSGSYNDLTDQPTLFSGDYNDLSNQPTLFSGDYNDLTNKPTTLVSSINDLSDVTTGTTSTNDVLTWNGSVWAAVAPSGGGSSSLTGLSDVTLTNLQAGEILKWNGSDWVNATDATGAGGAEADTLDTVTGRGSVTTNNIEAARIHANGILATGPTSGSGATGTYVSVVADLPSGASAGDYRDLLLQTTNGGGIVTYATFSSYNSKIEFGSTYSLVAGGLTYPNSNGTSGQVLSSDGTGNITWSTLSIPAAQVNSDWNATSGLAEILNKPYLPTFSTTNPSDGQILTWNATNSEWQPDNVGSGSVTSINDIGDVNVPNPTDGHVLKWNASTSKWIASADLTATGGAGISLSDLSVTVNAAGTAGLTYGNTTGVFSYTPPDLSGYLTSLGDAAGVTTAKISNWDDAYSWGDHSLSGYATETYVNTALTNLNNWDTAYGWGDHSAAGYLTSYSETDTLTSVTGRGNSTTNSITAGGNGSSGGVTLSDGNIAVRTGTGNVAAIDLYCEVNNAHKISIKAPPHSNFSGNINFVLPPNAGTSGKVLSTDGTGVTSWVDRSTFSGSYNDLTNKPTIPSTLDQLTDVSVGSVSDGDYLKYTSSGWTHGTITEFSGNYNDLSNKPTIPTNIGDLSDVDFSGSTTVGYVLKWDGSEWSPAQDTNYPTGGIGGLTDVDFGGGSPSDDQVLVYDSSSNKWKNESPSSGVPSGTIVMYNSGTAPSGWAVCDGSNGTPDLRGRFILGSGGGYTGTGGSADAVVVSHSHNSNASSSTHNGHTHGQGNLSTSNEGGHSHNVSASGGSNTGNQSNNHYHTISENITVGGGSHSHTIEAGDGTDDNGNSGVKDTGDWEGGHFRSTSNVGHNHNFNLTVPTQGISQNHTHSFNVTVNGNTDNQGSHSHNVTGNTGSDGGHDHSINVTIGSQGESGTGKNLPPYYVLTYIMKL